MVAGGWGGGEMGVLFSGCRLLMIQDGYVLGTSVAIRWLRLHASTVGGAGLIPGQGIKIPHAARGSQKIN